MPEHLLNIPAKRGEFGKFLINGLFERSEIGNEFLKDQHGIGVRRGYAEDIGHEIAQELWVLLLKSLHGGDHVVGVNSKKILLKPLCLQIDFNPGHVRRML